MQAHQYLGEFRTTVYRVAGWLTVLFVLAPRSDYAASVSLSPLKDNTLIQRTNPAEQLSNGLGDIFVGRTNQDGQGPATISIRRGLIQFDVAGAVPAGATILSASLTMRDVMGLNGDPVVQLRRTLADWGEGVSFQNGGMGAPATNDDATWLYRFYDADDPPASPAWNMPGGDFSDLVSSEVVISDDLGGAQRFTWRSDAFPVMVQDLQSWLDHPEQNFGWTLLGDETRGQSAKRLNSGESTDPPHIPPVLNIEYQMNLAGDTNGDGEINLDDLNNVRNNFGATGPDDGSLDGDAFPFDGVVDLDDLNALRNGFGGATGGAPTHNVPEPDAMVIALVIIGAMAASRYRRAFATA